MRRAAHARASQRTAALRLPSQDRWPTRLLATPERCVEAVRLLSDVAGSSKVLTSLGKIEVVSSDVLIPIRGTRELVARGFPLDGVPLPEDLAVGVIVGRASVGDLSYDVVFDGQLGRFTAVPSELYRPLEHGSTSARADVYHESGYLRSVRALSELDQERLRRVYLTCETPEEHLLLSRVLSASGGRLREVEQFQAALRAAAGPFYTDGRQLLKLCTADGLQDLLGTSCALTASTYQKLGLDPREGLRILALGTKGLRVEQEAAFRAAQVEGEPGIRLERLVDELNHKLSTAAGDHYVAWTFPARDPEQGKRTAFLNLLASHLIGKPVPAPEGLQVILRGGQGVDHAVLVVGAREQRDLKGERHLRLRIRDPETGRSKEQSADSLLKAGVVAVAARARIVAKLGGSPKHMASARLIPIGARAGDSKTSLLKELHAIEGAALRGEWPDGADTWGERAKAKIPTDIDARSRFAAARRARDKVRLKEWPERLKVLAAEGQWDDKLDAELKAAAYALDARVSNDSIFADARKLREEKVQAERARIEAEFAQVLAAAREKLSALEHRTVKEIATEANQALRDDELVGFQETALASLDRRWPGILAGVDKLLRGVDAKDRPGVEASLAPALDKQRWQEAIRTLTPDMSFGEHFPSAGIPEVVYRGATDFEKVERQRVIERLLRFEPPATTDDARLLAHLLNALDLQMLRALSEHNYTIHVARHTITNAERDLTRRRVGRGIVVDFAEGLHRHEKGEDPRITARSFYEDGKLQLDIRSVLHEIGHAYDKVIRGTEERPSCLNEDFIAAFQLEHDALPPYFQQQPEFWADGLARYLCNPEHAQRLIPETAKTFKKLGYAGLRPDLERLATLQRGQRSAPVVNVQVTDVLAQVRGYEEINAIRAAAHQPLAPYVLEVVGDSDRGGPALAQNLADLIHELRAPNEVNIDRGENMVRITPALMNDADALNNLLTEESARGPGTLLYFEDLSQLDATASGFAVLQKFMERLGGHCPMLFQGNRSDLDRLKPALPTLLRTRCELAPLSRAQLAQAVVEKALDEGYQLSDEARGALEARLKDGGLRDAFALWGAVKASQQQRLAGDTRNITQAPEAVGQILTRDIDATPAPKEKDPLEELERMIGLDAAKRELRKVLAEVKVARAQRALGVASHKSRLNLLFAGNPGTGKTKMAQLFVEALHAQGLLTTNKIAFPLVQDLVAGNPEEAVKKLFEENKGGVIFFDEFHQLENTEAGQRAFRSMIAYLGNKEYADTVFIGAGYPDKLKTLIRDVDDGGERRFRTIPFEDYSQAELGRILDKMVVDMERQLTPEARQAALERIERERRRMKHFGNGGTVETVLDIANGKMIERVAATDEPLTKDLVTTLVAEDFQADPPATKESVWQEIEKLRGNQKVKDQLRRIAQTIEFNRDIGQDPLEGVEPYFFIEGPPGTGKSTLARILGRFFAAYDIIPTTEVVELSGPQIQGKWVGHTGAAVEKAVERAWGGTLFIDEVGGLAKAGGTFKDEVVKTLNPLLENHRGKFIMVVADYTEGKNLFFGMDAGLASRFGTTLTMEPLSGKDAEAEVCARLKVAGFTFTSSPALRAKLDELASLPSYASGRDVRSLMTAIRQHHADAYLKAKLEGTASGDPMAIIPEAVLSALDELIAKKRADSAVSAPAAQDPALYKELALPKAQERVPAKVKDKGGLTAAERRLDQILLDVDKEFAARFNTDAAEQHRQEQDVNSAYIRRIAEKLGVSPKEAKAQLEKLGEKKMELLKVKRLVKRFVYDCPYCQQVDSPTCAYKDMPLEWKVQHSRQKPWTEVEETTVGAQKS